MIPHSTSQEQVLTELQTDVVKGLSDAQVAERKEKFGENKLKEKKKKTLFQRFFEQFKDAMIIILLIAAAVSLGIAIYNAVANNHLDVVEMVEPFLILAIVLINAIMGVAQESKAEKALDALKNMSAPHARVIRNGTEKIIMSSSLSSSNYCFLICIQISQEAGQVVWYSHLFQNFPQFIVIHTVKGFGIVNKSRNRCFSGTLLLFP